MRADGISLKEASGEFQIDPRTVIRRGGVALRKTAQGRYAARAHDQLLRVLTIPTLKGVDEIAIRDSRQASKLAKYWDAVRKYLQTGIPSDLQRFRNRQIVNADSQRIPLVTDLAELDRLGSAGVLSFESLYVRVA